MILIILQSLSFSQFITVLKSTPFFVVAAAVVGYLIGQVISAYKWYLIISAESSINLKFSKVLSAYFIGMYVNAFGLGIVGGDVVRGLLASPASKTHGVATVVADRFHGLAVLAFLGIASALLFGHSHLGRGFIYLLAGIVTIVVLGWAIGPYLLKILSDKYTSLNKTVNEIVKGFPRSFNVLGKITVISFCFHLLQIFLHWLILYGVGASPSFFFLLMTVPFVNILSSLPISWNGLGVRETAYLFFFTPFYATKEQCVALGLIWLFAMTFSAALGGVAAVLTGDLKGVLLKEKASEYKPSEKAA